MTARHGRRWSRKWRRACAAGLLLLGGCHATQYRPPIAPPPEVMFVAKPAPARPAPPPLPAAVALPDVIDECLHANPRVLAAAEKIAQARAEFQTSSQIPNPELLVDSLMNSMGERFTPVRQGGPPQADVALFIPIDWFVFRKRAAAMDSAGQGIDVADADFANFVRQRVAEAVLAYYDLLEAKELHALARDAAADLLRVEGVAASRPGADPVEHDRARLAVLEAQKEEKKRDLSVSEARARLRGLLGRTADLPGFDARGDLTVTAPAEPPAPEDARLQAEQGRPDIAALQRQIARADAEVRKEKARAYPEMFVQPLFTYQFQRDAIAQPDARSFGVALYTKLPLTDRNQGNIEKAYSLRREADLVLRAALADLHTEVEQAVEEYRAAVAALTAEDAAAQEAAQSVRDRTETAFAAGERRLLDVLDAQRAHQERARAAVSARADYWRALHKLNAALGGDVLFRRPSCP